MRRGEGALSIAQWPEDKEKGVIHVYTDDPYWLKRLDQVAATVLRWHDKGWYTIEQSQLVIRPPKPALPRRKRAPGHTSQTGTEEHTYTVKEE